MDNTNVSEKETISLVVKTPNQFYSDQLVEGVRVDWTVKDLKCHLAEVYPTNPSEKEQRLIYSGKLLQDNLLIREVFSKVLCETRHIIHLVCAVKTPPGARPKVSSAASSSCSSSGSVSSPQPSTDGVRQRNYPATSAAAWPDTSSGSSTSAPGLMNQASFPTYSLYSPQQLLWWQQMYARQYYMQYHAALAAASSTPMAAPAAAPSLPVAAHQAAVPVALPNQGPINDLPANQNAPGPAFINAEGVNQNLRMNAQGGPVMEDEEDMNRDWLDWVYTGSRLAVFLSIVYFYSSLSRFVLVMSSLMLMYLYTVGWFPFRRRDRPAPAARVVQENQEHENPAAPPTEDAPEEEPSMTTPVLVPPIRPPFLWTAWLFFKTFFASLIPDAPQGLVN